MAGIPITEENLAVDLIDRVGPGGHYLTEPETLNNFRKIKYSDLFDRMGYDKWKKDGAKTFEQRLQELTLKKMMHRPQPLSTEIVKELDRMQAGWQ
jgi:trimethylamine--corrinoid protein Co-methyltransferase